jgi:hypothetical protein
MGAVILAALISGCSGNSSSDPGKPSSPEDLSDPSILPKLIFSNPGNNSTGPYSLYNPGTGESLPHLVLRYNKYINTQSIGASAISVSGFTAPVSVRPFTGDSTMSKLYTDMLLFSIVNNDPSRDPLPADYTLGRSYIITIDSTIEDINGHHLGTRQTIIYTPEPSFRLVSSVPSDGTANVEISAPFEVAFNSPINTSTLSGIQFQPAMAGHWTTDPYRLLTAVFEPASPLPYGTVVTAVISQRLADVFGHTLPHDAVISFSVIPFRVREVIPQNGSVGVWPSSSLQVDFSGPIDTATVRSSITIDPPTNGRILFYGSHTIDFIPTSGWVQTTLYTIRISGVQSNPAGVDPAPDFTWSFSTDQFRAVLSNPADGSSNVSRTAAINLEFNAPLDTGSVRTSLNISPLVRGTLIFYQGSSGFSFVPSTPYTPHTQYTVSISPGLRTLGGSVLATGTSFSFTTAD